jgi:septal ring factor EnvC (AmiA/AmiB activator)
MQTTRVVRALIVTCSLAAGSHASLAQESELKAVEEQLDQSQSRQGEIAAEMQALAIEADALSSKLIGVAQKIQGNEARISAGEDRIAKLNGQYEAIKQDLAVKQDVLAELLAALQRLEQNPPPALVVDPDDILGALRGAMMFGAVVPEMRNEAFNLVQKLERLDNIRAKLAIERDDLKVELAKLQTSRKELEDLGNRKKQLLMESGTRLSDERERAKELAGKAENLKQLLASLAEERAGAQAREQAEERKRREALMKPRLAFAESKGRVDYPVQGQILRRYGQADGFGGKTKGIFIATRTDAQVTIPADGRVEFAGPFRSYGELLILNAGSGYHVLLAGLEKISVETGQFVRAGEPVGEMGKSAAPGTLTGDAVPDRRPVLYIEFRKNGEAVDSAPWWIGSAREARG